MRRQLRVTIDGQSYDVTVEDLTVTDNALYPRPGSMAMPPPGPPVAAGAAPTPPAGAEPPGPSPRSSFSSGASEQGSGQTAVTAPMSGVLQDVPVRVGDAVEAGQVVAVIEAMKLKSPLVATVAGTVASIDVAVGDAVETGTTILTLA